MNNKSTRQYNIELLRLLAMLGIVMMHMMNHGHMLMFARKGEFNYYASWSLFSVGMHSINLLLLISGYFMIYQRFSTWKVYKIASQVFFYSVGIGAYFWLFTDIEKKTKDFIYWILPVTSDFYWYPSMYIGMLLLSPILNKLIFSLTKKQLRCVCVLIFTLVSVWPNIAFFSSALNTAGGVSISWFLCVYVFGAYIRIYYVPDGKWKKKLLITLCMIAMLPLSKFFIEWMLTTPIGRFTMLEDLLWGYSVFFQYSSILVTASSIMIFITFLNIKIDSRVLGKMINIAASASFGVYLIHDHMYVRDNMWDKLAVYNWLETNYLIPASIGMMFAIYIVCMVIELLRQKIFLIWERNEKFCNIFKKADDKLLSYWSE